MRITPDNKWIDDIRRQIQAKLNDSKRDVLRERFGMMDEYHSPDLSPEVESEWLDYVLEFERQFENEAQITVRARIGNPAPPPFEALNPDDLVPAVEALMDLLAAHNIAVDFAGDMDYETVYHYLTEELLDEEIDDIRIPDMWLNFTYATDAYNAENWVGQFVNAILRQDMEEVQTCVDDEPWADISGSVITARDLEALWARMPATRGVVFQALETQITGDEGRIIGRIAWPVNGSEQSIEAIFHVRRSRWLDEAWRIERTSLIDELRGLL